MSNPDVLIRKYSDRRLYDTTASRYVRLEDIARMVREGLNVEVRDARTGKDLTHMILTQIIVENARDQDTALPLQLLQQLIKVSDHATHDFVSWYLASTLDLYQKAQETVRTRISEAKSVVSNPLDFVRHLLAGNQWPPSAGDEAPSTADEVAMLRRRVKELEARLAEIGQPYKQDKQAAGRSMRKRRKGKGELAARSRRNRDGGLPLEAEPR